MFGAGRDGAVTAVDSVDLEVADGEFFAMLGPSGSGKTTVLRMIAGFETPTAGTVELGGRDVTSDAPFDRDVNTVFQDYALFPHMTSLENVEYGLMVKGRPKASAGPAPREALATVRLEDFGARRPAQLSGGQRQRVALARALVNRPKVLLLDEPLGALDLKLREQMQVELKAIQREVGITFLFVTHDQEEALTMSDRIAVFNHGRIEQVGTPAEVYERPATRVRRRLRRHLEPLRCRPRARARRGRRLQRPPGEDPRRVRTRPPPSAEVARAPGTVVEVVYVGAVTRFVVDLDAGGTPGRPAAEHERPRPTPTPTRHHGSVSLCTQDARRPARRRARRGPTSERRRPTTGTSTKRGENHERTTHARLRRGAPCGLRARLVAAPPRAARRAAAPAPTRASRRRT